MGTKRRDFLKAGAAGLAVGAAGCSSMAPAAPSARVAVVGGGFAGATAAKTIRRLDPSIEVTLIEPNEAFVSCPLSNLVLSGFRSLESITRPYTALESRHGVLLVRDAATAVDAERKVVHLARGKDVAFDRVIVAPGIDFMRDAIPGLASADAQQRVLHAWKAGPQTAALRRQLEQMRDGGVYVLSIPEAPYRCPPGPYERACQVAAYFRKAKPRSKVIILDANPDVTSKGALFKKAWATLYPGVIDYHPNSKAHDVDARSGTVKLEVAADVKGDVVNVLPPMRAGRVAEPFVTANKRWCEVDWLTYESKAARNVHVIGDSLQLAPLMPKSGHMANAQAKVCAAAVVALLHGKAPSPAPVLSNTCYSWVSDTLVMHVASVHKYDVKDRTMKVVPGSGGLSAAMNADEVSHALNWAYNIWGDTLA